MSSQKKPFPAFPQQSNPSQRLVWEADVRDAQQQEEDGKLVNPITPHEAHENAPTSLFSPFFSFPSLLGPSVMRGRGVGKPFSQAGTVVLSCSGKAA